MSSHVAWTDIEVEAKFKNLASHQLAEHVRRDGWNYAPPEAGT